MAEQQCDKCSFRAKYDAKPRSILGRLWRWHINWCPGWKKYMTSLPEEEKMKVADKYNLAKYKK
ncbi:MAG: hypothetical protein A2Y62_04790 [Candidatus Fischerbacteria bacterium RBG_13_37_8]|uniref:Uncharacterized protein n=1 Tax=Candidatus Fischerbacteria bacterium RBG_13_37_8 TaxID=1817863 RepID=A0A1F5VHM0_9BACT|nr:MAG: hypothetical protein A2Y62_04790 [Candidatus Fischerbacteria bacterium RBG_13_37_8]